MTDHTTRTGDDPIPTHGSQPVELSKTDELKVAKIGSALRHIHADPVAAKLPTEMQDLLKLLS